MAEHPGPEDAPAPDLLEAIEVAARHVGSARVEPDAAVDVHVGTPGVVRFDAPRTGRARLALLGALLLAAVAGTAYLSLRPRGEPPPREVEADLRWAVGQVVRRVEALRLRTGELPPPEDLRGLVSDLVVYEPLGDGYWVVGQRGPVRVEFDGSLDLERWERLRVY